MNSKPFSIAFTFLVSVVGACLANTTASAAVWYVDKDNTGTEDGTSWSTAFNAIQEGIHAAMECGHRTPLLRARMRLLARRCCVERQ